MESKVLFGTVMKFATKDAKGGALVVQMEFPLTGVNAAYFTDIKGKNCKMDMHPEEGQRELDSEASEDDNVLDFPEQDGDPEVNPDDEEEMNTDMEDSDDEQESGGLTNLDAEDPDTEYLDDDAVADI